MSAASRRRGSAETTPLPPPRADLASHPRSCKQNQDLLSFYAVVMGLDNAAVSRLRLTWEVMHGCPLLSSRLGRPGSGILACRVHPGAASRGAAGP